MPHAEFELIIYNGLVRGVNTEKYIHKYIKPTISILGLLQVVGTVKNIKLQPVPSSMPSEAL